MLNRLKLHETAPNGAIPLRGDQGATGVLPSGNIGFRFGVSCLLAGGITLGLFGVMQALIYVKDIKVVEEASRVLTSITPLRTDHPGRPIDLHPVEPDSVPVPPPLPRTQSASAIIDMPVVMIETRAPRLPSAGNMLSVLPQNVVLSRRAEPLSPPSVQYPRAMAAAGVSGSCEVTFSLSIRGLPFDPVATCTHAGFESAALKAVKRAEFLPQVGANGPIEAHGMIYPIDFQLK